MLGSGGKEGGKSYNLAESDGGEGNDEEDGGTHGFFFRVVNRLVKEGKGWCVDIIIKKPPILFVMYGAAASFDKLYISLSL